MREHDLAWFPAFAKALMQRSGRTDWRPPGSEYWIDFERSLFGIDCTEDQADRASREVCDLPNVFPSDYRPKILEAIRRIKLADANAPLGQANGTREQAIAASKGCPECGGSGTSSRYAHADNRDRFRGAPIGTSFANHCGSCPHGSYLAQLHAPDNRLPRTWADVPGMAYPCKAYYRPSQWDESTDSPLPDPDPAVLFDRSNLAMLRKRPRPPQERPARRRTVDVPVGFVEPPQAKPGPVSGKPRSGEPAPF